MPLWYKKFASMILNVDWPEVWWAGWRQNSPHDWMIAHEKGVNSSHHETWCKFSTCNMTTATLPFSSLAMIFFLEVNNDSPSSCYLNFLSMMLCVEMIRGARHLFVSVPQIFVTIKLHCPSESSPENTIWASQGPRKKQLTRPTRTPTCRRFR